MNQTGTSSHGQEVIPANKAKDEASDPTYLQMCEKVEQGIAQTTLDLALPRVERHRAVLLSRMQVADVVSKKGEGGDASPMHKARHHERSNTGNMLPGEAMTAAPTDTTAMRAARISTRSTKSHTTCWPNGTPSTNVGKESLCRSTQSLTRCGT